MMGDHWHSGGKPDYTVRAVVRVCGLLDELQKHPCVGLDEFTKAVEEPKATVFRYLTTLQDCGYVEHDPETGCYRLGPAFIPLRTQHVDLLVERARGHLRALRDQLGETISLGVLENHKVLYIDVAESAHNLRVCYRRGEQHPFYESALGIVLAAQLPDEKLAALGVSLQTAPSDFDPAQLMRRVQAVRERGWALVSGEHAAGSLEIAVALPGDRLIAGLSIGAPAARLSLERADEIATELTRHAAEIVRPVNESHEAG